MCSLLQCVISVSLVCVCVHNLHDAFTLDDSHLDDAGNPN